MKAEFAATLVLPFLPALLPAQPAPGPRMTPGAASAAAQVLLVPSEMETLVAEVRAADNERVAAILAADATRLDAILSDDLHYAHSNGRVDTKASYIESLLSRKTVYRKYDYQRRDFTIVSPEIALMTGRLGIEADNHGRLATLDLSVLAVFRKEAGRWRFLAWQSAQLPSPAAPAAK